MSNFTPLTKSSFQKWYIFGNRRR